jgi:hypothetical protein
MKLIEKIKLWKSVKTVNTSEVSKEIIYGVMPENVNSKKSKPIEEFNQVKEFGTHGNPYSPVYPIPDAYGVVSTNITASSITLEEKGITIDGWVARDENNMIYIFDEKPHKSEIEWHCGSLGSTMLIKKMLFPEVKWKDAEPTKVKLIIEKV